MSTQRTVEQIEQDISNINQEAARLTAWSKKNQSPVDAGRQYLEAQESRLLRLAGEAFRAEWTPEVFAVRRAECNAAMAALPRHAKGVKFTDVLAVQKRLGYTLDDLRNAKKMLGIV